MTVLASRGDGTVVSPDWSPRAARLPFASHCGCTPQCSLGRVRVRAVCRPPLQLDAHAFDLLMPGPRQRHRGVPRARDGGGRPSASSYTALGGVLLCSSSAGVRRPHTSSRRACFDAANGRRRPARGSRRGAAPACTSRARPRPAPRRARRRPACWLGRQRARRGAGGRPLSRIIKRLGAHPPARASGRAPPRAGRALIQRATWQREGAAAAPRLVLHGARARQGGRALGRWKGWRYSKGCVSGATKGGCTTWARACTLPSSRGRARSHTDTTRRGSFRALRAAHAHAHTRAQGTGLCE